MSSVTVISLVALLISALTFLAAVVGGHRTETTSYIDRLEARNAELEKRVETLEAKVATLEDENLRLLKKVVG